MTQTSNGKTFADRTLTCADCHREFEFSAGEQAFYADKGFVNDPKRCPTCRKHRNDRNEARDKMVARGQPDRPHTGRR